MKIIYVPAQVLTDDTTILRESIHRRHAEKVLSGIFEQDIVDKYNADTALEKVSDENEHN